VAAVASEDVGDGGGRPERRRVAERACVGEAGPAACGGGEAAAHGEGGAGPTSTEGRAAAGWVLMLTGRSMNLLFSCSVERSGAFLVRSNSFHKAYVSTNWLWSI
jgi:hypothetical protein